MAMAIYRKRNMGLLDRAARGVLGSLLLLHSLRRRTRFLRRWEGVIGGVFLVNGLSGFDPLLAALRMTTLPDDDINVLNLAKQALPGHGDKPMSVTQPVPRRVTRQQDFRGTLSQTLAIE
ncbi:MAG TPA: YgaP-like transmembrane domain [Coleofasciculaceae cyanobacterium]|jgi:hypothetical protein